MAPQHRRRRGLALLAFALIALLGSQTLSDGGRSKVRRIVVASVPGVRVTARRDPRVSAAARERRRETLAIDRTLAYTPYVRIAGAQHREVALTFDDGPGPYTPRILATLEHFHLPATFFQVGVLERWFHASTSRILADGFAIGDHTMAHAPMSRLSPSDQRLQLLEVTAVLGSYGASFPRLFRPPYGLWDAATLKLLRRYRMLMVLWTVDTQDYRRPGVRAIVRRGLAGVRPGAIILLHDAGGNRRQTSAALPLIIRALRARGYRMVTVPRLLADNPPPADQSLPPALQSGG